MPTRTGLFGTTAVAALICVIFAGVANAEPTTFSGTVANGGCDAARSVTVSGPSRIAGQVASSDSADPSLVYVQISHNGNTVAQTRYDTPGGGTYQIQVCSYYDHISPPSLHYTARYATGPAGQPALPQSQGGVAGVSATLTRSVHGSGAINTRHGLAWFTVKKSANDLGVVKVYDPRHHKRYMFTRALIRFTSNGVRFVQGSMTLRIAETASGERVTFHSPRYRTSGTVVRGGYLIA
jgi:hypothetical protein